MPFFGQIWIPVAHNVQSASWLTFLCSNMAPQFEFIDNSLIDRKSRRTIRSHVMKGRNLGKVRTPRRPFRSSRDAKPHNFSVPYERSYEKNKVILPDLLFLKASSQQDGTLSGQNETRLRLITQVGNGLSVLASTWDLTPSSQRIILNCKPICFSRCGY